MNKKRKWNCHFLTWQQGILPYRCNKHVTTSDGGYKGTSYYEFLRIHFGILTINYIGLGDDNRTTWKEHQHCSVDYMQRNVQKYLTLEDGRKKKNSLWFDNPWPSRYMLIETILKFMPVINLTFSALKVFFFSLKGYFYNLNLFGNFHYEKTHNLSSMIVSTKIWLKPLHLRI